MKRAALVSPAERALGASATEIWATWSEERDRRELQARARATVAQKIAADEPIYPRECAERIAADTQHVAPDWRHIRPTLGAPWGRLLKAQPERAPEITKQREAVVTAVFNAVPSSLQGTVRELRTLIDLLLVGHEASAYQVGFEAGKIEGRQHEDERGRLRSSTRAPRKPGALRLHDGTGGHDE
ncbi:hypothetical protein BH24ACI5_BH24ACI5_04200 [soil metagenome]